MTNAALLAAAALTVFIGIVHSWLGEVKLIGPLLAPATRTGILERSGFARDVLRFAWHVTTVAWWGMAAVFAGFALLPAVSPVTVTLVCLSATLFLTGVMILVAGRGRHWGWPVFWAAAGLALVPLA